MSLKRAILAFALMAGIAPAFAQVPAAVPALPDSERRTSYSITATTCACNVNFALFGDGTDYQNWVEVFINGVRYDYNDASFGWTITSPSGALSGLARPITNAVLTFNSVQTGTVQIVGARRPRRTSQFSENAGVSARNINQVLTDIIAQNREIWDKTNDMTGRALISQPGNTMGLLPLPSACQGKYLAFDVTGLIPQCNTGGPGSGNVVGPGSSVDGDFAVYSGASGAIIKDVASTVIQSALQNRVWASPNGGTGAPTFRALVGADLPNPSASTLGGIESLTCASHQWLNTISIAGVPACSQPAVSDISGFGTGVATALAVNANASGGFATVGNLVTSVTPAGGIVSSNTAACSQTAITTTGTLYGAQCVNAQTGSSYAILDADRGKLITATNAGAQAYTIAQAGAASAFASGWYVDIQNNSTNVAGIITVTPTTSTVNGASTLKIQPGQFVRIVSDGSNYQIHGPPTAQQLPATTTNDAANAGNVGEYIESNIASGSAVALTTATAKDVTTISLTAGDWDVTFTPAFSGGASTTVSYLIGSISTTLNTLDTTNGRWQLLAYTGTPTIFSPTPSTQVGMASITVRLSLSGTTTVHAVAQGGFGAAALSGFGLLRARRMR